MNQFKPGDRVKRITSSHEGMKVGDVAVVRKIFADHDMLLEGYRCVHDPKNFELVVEDEKESIAKWLKENRWFIQTGSPEKSKIVQEWLFEHGMRWYDGSQSFLSYNEDYLTNLGDTFGAGSPYTSNPDPSRNEIKIEFQTIIKSVHLPAPTETEQEKKIRELQETIDKASAQIKELKGLHNAN